MWPVGDLELGSTIGLWFVDAGAVALTGFPSSWISQASWRRWWLHCLVMWAAHDVVLGDPSVVGASRVVASRSFSGGHVRWWYAIPRGGQVVGVPPCGPVRRSGRNPCVSAPASAMLVGVMYFLTVLLWSLSPSQMFGWKPLTISLVSTTTMCCVVSLMRSSSWNSRVLRRATLSSVGIYRILDWNFLGFDLVGPRYPQVGSGSTIGSRKVVCPLHRQLYVSDATRSDEFPSSRVSLFVDKLGCFKIRCGFSSVLGFTCICSVRKFYHHHVMV